MGSNLFDKKKGKDNNINEFENNENIITIEKGKRKAIVIIGIVLLLIGGVGILFLAPSKNEKNSQPLSYKNTYYINADSNYKVYMLPNKTLGKEWLGEKYLYPVKLTDYIEIYFRSNVFLKENIKLSGTYSISAVINGYQTDEESRLNVYEKKFPLKSGRIDKEKRKNVSIKESLSINPKEYKKIIDSAETEIGGSTLNDFHILFEGKYIFDSKEYPFSYKVSINIDDETFYSVTKPKTIIKKGGIGEPINKKTLSNIKSYIPYILFCLIGIVAIVFTLLRTKTKEKSEEELWDLKLNNIIKKYGNRMICLKNMPEFIEKNILKLDDIESMIILSEEIRKPIFYALGVNLLPDKGEFYVFGEKYVYMFKVE